MLTSEGEAKPFQDEAKPAHRKSQQCALPKVQTLDPGEADCDEIYLNVNCAEIFKNKRNRIHRGRGLEEMRSRKQMSAINLLPVNQRLEQGSERAHQDAEIDQPPGGAELLAERAHETAM